MFNTMKDAAEAAGQLARTLGPNWKPRAVPIGNWPHAGFAVHAANGDLWVTDFGFAYRCTGAGVNGALCSDPHAAVRSFEDAAARLADETEARARDEVERLRRASSEAKQALTP